MVNDISLANKHGIFGEPKRKPLFPQLQIESAAAATASGDDGGGSHVSISFQSHVNVNGAFSCR